MGNDMLQIGCHRYGARIIQKALNSCSAEVTDTIAKELLDNVCHVQQLMANEAGCLVLKSLLLSEQHSEKARGCLQQVPVPTIKGKKKIMKGRLAELIELLNHM